MAALFILILKTIIPSERLTPEQLGVNDGEVNGFGVSGSVKHAKKSKKTFKSQNLAKSRNKLSKSENSTNFDAIKAELKFLTPNTKIAFNCL